MSKFEKLKEKLASKGAKSPGGLAYFIGKKKLGKAKMTQLSIKGKEKKENY